MKEPIKAEEIHIDKEKEDDFLRAYIEMLWLRPASALWHALEDKHLMKFLPFEEPAIDLGCGDGTKGALLCGVRFGLDFDMYLSIKFMTQEKSNMENETIYLKTASKEDEYYKGGDPYLYYNKEDYEGKVEILKKPKNRFEWGVDIAPTLLKKAAYVGVYDKLAVADLSKPLDMLPSNHFKTIYSNVTYWMENKEQLFKEQYRILTKDGCILMSAQDPSISEEISLYAIFEKNMKKLGYKKMPQWAEEMERGRLKQGEGRILSDKEWRELFDKTGFKVAYYGTYMTPSAYWHYDVDNRETFPALSKHIQLLNRLGEKGKELRRILKEDMVEHYFKKWQQFFHDPGNWQKGMRRGINFYKLIKK